MVEDCKILSPPHSQQKPSLTNGITAVVVVQEGSKVRFLGRSSRSYQAKHYSLEKKRKKKEKQPNTFTQEPSFRS